MFLNVTSTLLNIVFILAVVRSKRLRSFANVFMTSLALSNLLLAIVIEVKEMGFLIAFYKKLPYRRLQCLYLYIFSISMTCSLYNHFLIASERWLYIVRPFFHQRMVTYKSTICGAVLSWVISLLGGVHLVSGSCTDTFFAFNLKTYYWVFISVIHFVLSTSMFIIYGHIAMITRHQTNIIKRTALIGLKNSTNELDQKISNLKSTWKQIRMLVIVFGVYFLLMTPSVVANIYMLICNIELKFYNENVGRVTSLIGHAQCGANFFTYCLQDRNFRLVLKQCCWKTKKTDSRRKVGPLPSVTS